MNRHDFQKLSQGAFAGALLLAASLAPVSAQTAAPQKVTVRAVAHSAFDSSQLAAEDQSKLLAEVGTMKDVTW
ncbi:MAG: hypothetical protein ABIN96_18220 [Rubrivivax sp.]